MERKKNIIVATIKATLKLGVLTIYNLKSMFSTKFYVCHVTWNSLFLPLLYWNISCTKCNFFSFYSLHFIEGVFKYRRHFYVECTLT